MISAPLFSVSSATCSFNNNSTVLVTSAQSLANFHRACWRLSLSASCNTVLHRDSVEALIQAQKFEPSDTIPPTTNCVIHDTFTPFPPNLPHHQCLRYPRHVPPLCLSKFPSLWVLKGHMSNPRFRLVSPPSLRIINRRIYRVCSFLACEGSRGIPAQRAPFILKNNCRSDRGVVCMRSHVVHELLQSVVL